MRQLAQATSALRLNNQDLLDCSSQAQSGTLTIKSTTIGLLSQLVQGLVTVSHELSGVTQVLATISKANENLRKELHEMSSQLVNHPPAQNQQPPQGITDLQASIRDLSHHVSAPIPAPPAPASHTGHPNPNQRPAPPYSGRVKKGPVYHALPPQPRLTTLNKSYHGTIQSLARRSVTLKSTPSCSPSPTKPQSSRRGGTTSTPSPPATSTLTMSSPPPKYKLPLAQAQVARARTRLGSLLPPN